MKFYFPPPKPAPRCPEGFRDYVVAERVARRRTTNPELGCAVWRCMRCPLFHIGTFALDKIPEEA